MSAADVELMKGPDALPAAFSDALDKAATGVGPYLTELPDIPYPQDAGGGYSHEQHKRNPVTMLNAGILYQLTGDVAYAGLVRDMLRAYAQMYPALGDHPKKGKQSPGKLFWQSLNESVWLLTTIQGYDAIYTACRKRSGKTSKTTCSGRWFPSCRSRRPRLSTRSTTTAPGRPPRLA